MKKFILVCFMLTAMGMGSLAQTAILPSAGNGSRIDPYQIESLGNLYWIAENSNRWEYHFIQISDIDASRPSTGSRVRGGYLSVTLQPILLAPMTGRVTQ